VRTDEAKYLLDIPYPHPPLARFILSTLDGWYYQEFFWRFVFATLLIQAVWLLLRLVHDLRPSARMAVGASWLLGSAIIYQAATVMMAPLTALETLLFVYLLLRDDDHESTGFLALLWLASLFTAYQAALFAPLVWGLLRRSKSSISLQLSAFFIPILLLALYTLTNPLVVASMTVQAHKNVSDTIAMRLTESLRVWALGGSIFLSAIGTYGIIRSKSFALIGSFLLVTAYILLGRFDYYAILFTPLFLAGLIVLLRRRLFSPLLTTLGTIVGTILIVLSDPLLTPPSDAASVMQQVTSAGATGPILISGYFGHEWEYQSNGMEVLRYESSLLGSAHTVICLSKCPDFPAKEWQKIMDNPAVYIRQSVSP
jgi:hypothetical protein